MGRKRTEWSQEDLDVFIAWHNMRMEQLGYSPEVIQQLVKDRSKFLPAPKKST